MSDAPRHFQRTVVGLTSLTLALLVQGGAWTSWHDVTPDAPRQLLLLACLVVAVVLSFQFPIYIRHHVKLCLSSIPLFVAAALLPPPLAASGALVAVLLAETAVCRQRGTIAGDIATSAARLSTAVLAASLVAHLTLSPDFPRDVLLVLAAVTLFAGDTLSLPLVLCPIAGERPLVLIRGALREGGLAEIGQYLIALVGVLLVSQQVWALALLIVPAALVYLAFEKEVDQDTFQLLESMADNVDLRDPYLGHHSQRVARVARGILDEFGMHGQEAQQIVVAARLHDLGKIDLPERLLLKDGELTGEEQELLEGYPERGAAFLAAYPDLSRCIEMVRHHLEYWDGSGRAGLAGTIIPFGARVIAVADSFDALTHERPYRPALLLDAAAQVLVAGRGQQWDPTVVDAFLRSIADQLTQPITIPEPAMQPQVVLAAKKVPA